MERNADLFFDVADRVEFDPGSYSQGTWGRKLTPSKAKALKEPPECGARACIAGHALLLSGEYIVNTAGYFYSKDPTSGRGAPLARGFYGRSVLGAASRVLGLSDAEARILFDGRWRPRDDMTVSDALRRIGKGDSIDSVTLTYDER